MNPPPQSIHLPPSGSRAESDSDKGYSTYLPAGKLAGKNALVTGGDSGIGRATVILFAMEGADSAIVYLPEEEEDARETKRVVEQEIGGGIDGRGKRKCFLVPGDLSKGDECKRVVEDAVGVLGGLDVLVNNAAYQMVRESILDIPEEQWDYTFKVNIHAFYHLTKHSLPHLRASPNKSSTIINMTSINPYIGRPDLLDYTTTKGAIIAFTRSLSNQLVGEGIRVNAIAPGPIWTPLVVSTMTEEKLKEFNQTPMGRPGQPSEVATCCVFLASGDSSFISGSVLHPNGGTVVNG